MERTGGPGSHGTGPVEFGAGNKGQDAGADGAPAEHRPALGPGEELWSPGRPRAAEWWAGLSPERRALIGTATACAVLAGSVGYLLANRPPPPEPAPLPPPTLVTTVSFRGLDPPRKDPGYSGRTFRVRMSVAVAPASPEPVTVVSVSQGYASLSSKTQPTGPLTVPPGESRDLAMIVRVRDCARTPISAGMPLVNVTLRNTHAIRTRSEIFGERYAHALSKALRVLCPSEAKA